MNFGQSPFPSRPTGRPSTRLNLLLCTAFIAMGAASEDTITVDLTSGTLGEVKHGGSYNEMRAAAVTVVDGFDHEVSSLTLHEVDIQQDDSVVIARIFEAESAVEIASEQAIVDAADLATVTFPISAVLLSGRSYLIGVYVPRGSGGQFVPSTNGPFGFGYTDATGTLRVDAGFESPEDEYPTNPNLAIPNVSLEMTAGSTGCAGTMLAGSVPYEVGP